MVDDFINLRMFRFPGRDHVAARLQLHHHHRPVWVGFTTPLHTLEAHIHDLRDAGHAAPRRAGLLFLYGSDRGVVVWFDQARHLRSLIEAAIQTAARHGHPDIVACDGIEARLICSEGDRHLVIYSDTVEALETLLHGLVPAFTILGSFDRTPSYVRWREAQLRRAEASGL